MNLPQNSEERRPAKVVHLIDHMGLGGAQSLLLDLLPRLTDEFRSEIWSLSGRVLPDVKDRVRAAGAMLNVLGLSKTNPFTLRELARELRASAPDIVHTHLDYSNTIGAAVSRFASDPVIVTQLDNDPERRCSAVRRPFVRALSPMVSRYLAISPSVARKAEGVLRFPPGTIEVIAPGVCFERFDLKRVNRTAVRELRNGAHQVIGTVCRLAKQKSLDTLLAACAPLLREESKKRRLVVVGDGPLSGRLERTARALGIEGSVRFAGYRQDIPSAMAAFDVFVLPSSHEGFGLVFLEAMAMQIPVVGTRVTGTIDAVEDGVTGILVPPGDIRALRQAVESLLGDARLRAKLVQNAFEYVQQEGGIERYASAHCALYRELLRPGEHLQHDQEQDADEHGIRKSIHA